MTKYIATIQEGNEAENLKQELTLGLKEIAAESFGNDTVTTDVKWKVIPKGFAWTAGKPSNSSAFLCVVPDDLQFETRANFMTRVNDLWVGQTGADPNELLIFTVSSTL